MQSQFSRQTPEKILLAPYSPMTIGLKRANPDWLVSGFVDSSKNGDDIITPDKLANALFDRILILSPNHAMSIYRGLRQAGVPATKIRLLQPVAPYPAMDVWRYQWTQWWQTTQHQLFVWLHRYLKPRLQRKHHIVVLCPDFVDLNCKETYLVLRQKVGVHCWLATNHRPQIKRLKHAGFDIEAIGSWQFWWRSLFIRQVVMDHNPIDAYSRAMLQHCLRSQIWHGIPLKKIGHLANYKAVDYQLVVSTSDFVTATGFAPVFDARRFINCGYPRNDVLTADKLTEGQLALVNQAIYQWATQSDARLLVYMPTWRGDSYAANPLEIERLNAFCQAHNLRMVIKMHPFIEVHRFFDSIEQQAFQWRPDYPNAVVFYPADEDIYPLLRHTDLLITDYSSVYFDFLLVDKPIVFFVYDKDDYIRQHGDFCLEFEEHTPGIKAYDGAELEQVVLSVLKHDPMEDARHRLCNKLFCEGARRQSGEQLVGAILELEDQAGTQV